MVSDGTVFAVGDIEKWFDEARRNTKAKHESRRNIMIDDFMDVIQNCDRYKNDPDSVHELANLIIEERKSEESQQLELEKIREKSKLDLEIARIRANDKDNNTEVNCNDSSSLDSLIKSIHTLTVKIPDKPCDGLTRLFCNITSGFFDGQD
ncbi:hypothetical protein TNIN_442441 [Trichonephila inaurata madagascariensis]|uniref:Uncharacterized protein n=1 Tax=Trichonephila inaurata madagascariensis TaxID=2747483 RepID=A0A8X7CDK8_9ARAC|nr:hypothetical protein TNIN_442441 [Trichonephila inaurata madagascariensis]